MAATDRNDPSLAFTLPLQLTKTIRRQVYDTVSPENPANSQAGKIVVITGGGSGIGKASFYALLAAAHVWARAGAEGVVIAGRRKAELDKVAASIEELGTGSTKVLAVGTDLTVYSEVENLFQQVKSHFGRTADVVIANAGMTLPSVLTVEVEPDTWWTPLEVNLKGLHNTTVAFIKSQSNPKVPEGTVINISSGLAGLTIPGNSAYSISKSASHRYIEYMTAEYPTLRAFTTLPGIVGTETVTPEFAPYAKDDPELTGSLALYLAQPKADWLKGSVTSINWDVEEMEAHKQEILDKHALQSNWLPILPCCGGQGL